MSLGSRLILVLFAYRWKARRAFLVFFGRRLQAGVFRCWRVSRIGSQAVSQLQFFSSLNPVLTGFVCGGSALCRWFFCFPINFRSAILAVFFFVFFSRCCHFGDNDLTRFSFFDSIVSYCFLLGICEPLPSLVCGFVRFGLVWFGLFCSVDLFLGKSLVSTSAGLPHCASVRSYSTV